MDYRNLTDHEIAQLERQMCTCDEWSNIFVSQHFNPKTIYNSHFSGVVKIGAQESRLTLYGGIKRQAGIYNSTIHNCGIGNNCYINYVKNYISNYNIGDNVVINNVQLIANQGRSSFGNGLKIAVLDESGGREIMMYDFMSAQIAYIMTLYRYRPGLIKKFEKIISEYSQRQSYERGFIAGNCIIANTGSIIDMRIGPYTTIEGARHLENGTIVSNEQAPVFIGNNVIIRETIVLSGSKLADGVIAQKCFIGQGCELGKNYSAENSVFFANCQGFHGEACSVFAGPFTVTHHKSTLLIAGMYSFLNAGSGSNQSNHMYKLGPIHQGIVERGSKTTSDSYLLWPAKIGPFTLVMGRHYKNSDTSDMPFSYLIEKDDKSWLSPAVNLRSIGTIRDAMKWPKRDNRKDSDKIDCINYNLLSPFTIQKMVKAIDILEKLKAVSGETSQEYVYHNTSITYNSLRRGIQLYDIGIDKFLGNSVITRLLNLDLSNEQEMRDHLMPSSAVGQGEWLDLAGLIAPKSEIDNILSDIEANQLSDLHEIQNRLKALHDNYYDIEWNWSADLLQWRLQKPISNMTVDDILGVIEQWKKSVIGLDKMLYEDAKKEFTLSAMTGFGIDGGKETILADFAMVRGTFENNSLVQQILSHIEIKTALGDQMIDKLKSLKS